MLLQGQAAADAKFSANKKLIQRSKHIKLTKKVFPTRNLTNYLKKWDVFSVGEGQQVSAMLLLSGVFNIRALFCVEIFLICFCFSTFFYLSLFYVEIFPICFCFFNFFLSFIILCTNLPHMLLLFQLYFIFHCFV